MHLDQIAATTMHYLVGRLARRAAVAAIMAVFAVTAIYQITVAGTVALEARLGPLHAHLIIAGIYVTLALIAFVTLWTMRAKPAVKTETHPLTQPVEAQIAMLVEAAMLGYSLARKGDRARD